MALYINNSELEEVSRELAQITGTSIPVALLQAVQRELERQKTLQQILPNDDFFIEIRKIQERVANLPMLNNRPANEILYDVDGVPK
jgi:hypothetical protein